MEDSIKNRYEALKMLVVERQKQFDTLMAFMEDETTWMTSPASTKYHLC